MLQNPFSLHFIVPLKNQTHARVYSGAHFTSTAQFSILQMTILCMQELMSGFIMMLFLIFYYFPLTFAINNSTIDDSKSWRRCYGINRFGHTRYCIGKTSKCL